MHAINSDNEEVILGSGLSILKVVELAVKYGMYGNFIAVEYDTHPNFINKDHEKFLSRIRKLCCSATRFELISDPVNKVIDGNIFKNTWVVKIQYWW